MKAKKIFEKFSEDSDPIADMGIGIRYQISQWMKEIGEKDTDDNALVNAALYGKLDFVKYLVQNGANIHADDDYALKWASQEGHLDIVKYLVQNGADIHAWEDLALRLASLNGHLEVVKFLVQNGADIHADNDHALQYASENGYLEVVKFLVQNGADIHSMNDHALRYASDAGHLEVVKYLVQKGADIHADRDEALRWASLNGHLEVVKYLKSQMKKDKIVKESLFEKFSEDSDPIADMGIGPEYLLTKRIENFIELIKRDPNINDRHLRKVNVWAWGLVVKLNKIYSSFNSHARLVKQYIKEAKLDEYFKESTYSEGMWDTVNVYFHVKPEYKKLFLNFKTNVLLNEKFVEDTDPIDDMGIGISYYIKGWRNKISNEDKRLYLEQGIQTLQQDGKLKLITPHIIRGIRLEDDKLYFELFFSIEIDKNGKTVNSIDHIKTVLKNLHLSEFVVFKSSSFKMAVFIIEPEYVNLFRNLEYLNEKFVEDSDPITDMGIGAIPQRTFKTEDEFITWMSDIMIPYIFGKWPDDMVPKDENDTYIKNEYYFKILDYFEHDNFIIGKCRVNLHTMSAPHNWVKKLKKYHYGDEDYRPTK